MLKTLAAAVLGALALAGGATAGPALRVGAVEDAAIWADPSAQMDLARLAGFDTIRMTAQWTTGRTAVDPHLMGRLQRAATAATARGIQPVVSIYNQGGAWTPADDAGRRQFAQYAASVVRELPWVTTFIVGNEPNSSLYWQPQSGAASAYEQLLAAAYDAIKAARPGVTVVGGALDSRGSTPPSAFIQELGAAYRASGRNAPIMDVFDQHVYPDNSTLPPSMPHAGPSIGAGDYRKLVALLGKAFDGTAQHGSTLPILYGEFGIDGAIPPAKASLYTGAETAKVVDEATQARYYVEALKLALCQPTVVGFYTFHVVDEAALTGWQSGPFYVDGTPKSSLGAIRDAIAAAHAGTLARCPDATPPTVSIRIGGDEVTAAAVDDVGVGEVELVVNGSVVDVDYTAPYSFAWPRPKRGGYVLEVRALDAAGNVGVAAGVVGMRTLSGARGRILRGAGGTFAWRAPKTAHVTFKAPRALHVYAGARHLAGARVRFAARRGMVYRLSVPALPLSWRS
ncbi:MAG TPA: Ig-like domain-containing protein [Gaiellaceae bacterium]